MDGPEKILLLAGSAEARVIATALQGQGRALRVIMSEPPRGDVPMPVPFEMCGAPSLTGLLSAMDGTCAVIDASHGFDGAMTAAGFAAAQAAGVPFISLSRPMWDVGESPRWRRAARVADAMGMIGPQARVFAATGWGSLADCASFPGAVLMLRQTTPHDRKPPYDFVELVFGTPPFSVDSETALFQRLEVDTLVLRNLGGAPSRPKLDASLQLGLEVILIDRPPHPEAAQVVSRIEDVLAWAAAL